MLCHYSPFLTADKLESPLLCEVAWSEFPEYLGCLGFNCVCCFACSFGSSSQICLRTAAFYVKGSYRLWIKNVFEPSTGFVLAEFIVLKSVPCRIGGPWPGERKDKGQIHRCGRFQNLSFVVVHAVQRCCNGRFQNLSFVVVHAVQRCCTRAFAPILIIEMLWEGYAFEGDAADSDGAQSTAIGLS
ncbi:unnamed protein product [Ilex paraguariensis]|uniref:Uncharacterized protein n=1 Tax=Ilex paraguariensis TaxID=185542 RepID=A0ABC8TWH6_9AQUA